jgi:hypothetical protein
MNALLRTSILLTGPLSLLSAAEEKPSANNLEHGRASIQLVFSVWEYQDDAAKPQEPPLTGASLRERPGLRLVHSQTIHTRSGNRVISIGRLVGPESRADQTPKTTPTPERAGAAKSTLGENRGSVLEVEPVIGPDGISIDFQMDYEIHIPSAEPRRDLELKGITNLTVISGKEVMVQSGFLDQGARARQRRPYALVVKGEVLREQGQHREAATELDREQRERNKAIIQRAKEGLPVKEGSPASPR